MVGHIEITDNGEGNITGFRLNGNGSENFVVEQDGTIKVASGAVLDYETQSMYQFIAIASNTAGDSTPENVQIKINDVPDTPPEVKPLTIFVEENASIESLLGYMEFDTKGSVITNLELSGEGKEFFSLTKNGEILLSKSLDYETTKQYTLEVVASNRFGKSDPARLTVQVLNILDDEPSLKDVTFSIEENATVGSIIGQVIIESSGIAAMESIKLDGNGSQNFTIDSNGTIQLSMNADLDYERKKIYSLQVIAKNKAGYSNDANVTIRLLDIPDVPPVLEPFSGSIKENVPIGTVVGVVREKEGGDSPIISYELNGSEAFAIDKDGRINTLEPLDYRAKKTYLFNVFATNAAGKGEEVVCKVDILPDDQTKPVLALNGPVHVLAFQDELYTDPGAIAYDDIDGDITDRIRIENPVDTTAEVGTDFNVTYRVVDNAGNHAIPLIRTVTIVKELKVNLDNWKSEGDGEWEIINSKDGVYQRINGQPTVFYNNVDSQNDYMFLGGKITVKTRDDDDYIGFVLGYQEGDLSNEDANYLLIDWKQHLQDGGKPGLAISQVNGAIYNGDGAWKHGGVVNELQRGETLGDIGWNDYETYRFKIKFTSAEVQVYINDKLELNVTGNFQDGAFGFYNFSQSDVEYAAIDGQSEDHNTEKPTANAGEDQNISIGEKVVLDGSQSSGENQIESYVWKNNDQLVGIGEQVTIYDLNKGDHTISLIVSDKYGNSAQDVVKVHVGE
jgi:hypothetical protein